MNIVDCEQGTPEWYECRLGCITSSRIADVIAKRKRGDGELQCRIDMRWEIVGEVLTGQWSEHYVSRWMKEGKEKEPLARAEYEVQMDCPVELVGYVYHPAIKFAGCSPDGLIYGSQGARGAVEFKCPKLTTHLEYLWADEIPNEYMPQLLWQLACCPELEWIDFVSFHEAMRDKEQRLFRKRLLRSHAEVEQLIRGYEAEVEQFLSEVDATVTKIRERSLVAA